MRSRLGEFFSLSSLVHTLPTSSEGLTALGRRKRRKRRRMRMRWRWRGRWRRSRKRKEQEEEEEEEEEQEEEENYLARVTSLFCQIYILYVYNIFLNK